MMAKMESLLQNRHFISFSVVSRKMNEIILLCYYTEIVLNVSNSEWFEDQAVIFSFIKYSKIRWVNRDEYEWYIKNVYSI